MYSVSFYSYNEITRHMYSVGNAGDEWQRQNQRSRLY